MDKLIKFFRHDQIKIALGLGFCIITLAVVSKKILQVELSNLAHAVPGFVMIGYEVCYAKKKTNPKLEKLARPLFWNTAMIISSAVVLLYYYLKP